MTTLMMLRHAIMSMQDLRINIKAAISNILGINKAEVDQLPPANINSTIYSELDITNSSLSLNQVSQINISTSSNLLPVGQVNTVRTAEGNASLSATNSVSGNINVKRIFNIGSAEEDFSVTTSGNIEAYTTKNIGTVNTEIEVEQSSTADVSEIIVQEAILSEQLSLETSSINNVPPNIIDNIENNISLSQSAELNFYEVESYSATNNIVLENTVSANADQGASSIISVSFGIGLTAGLESVEPIIPGHENFITFSSAIPFTLSVANNTKNWDGTLETSTDMYGWNEWDGTSAVSSSSGGKLYVRGSNNTIISGSDSKNWVLTGSNVSCSGNIMNLLNYNDVSLAVMGDYCFRSLFRGCSALISAPELPATVLSPWCYTSMFAGCTSLINCPILPATTLATRCYYMMFESCTSMRTATSLPATTIPLEYAYASMFWGCTSLEEIPALPATNLNWQTIGAYSAMFEACSKLKLSTTQDSDYTQEYQTIPYGGDPSGTPSLWPMASNMFSRTGGTFTGTPSSNTMYYLHKDCRIVLPGWEDPIQEGNSLSIKQSYVAQQVGSELFIN